MVKWVFSVLQNAWKCSVYAIKQKSDIKFYRNLNSFAQENLDNSDFIRKYLTLTKCDLFFADKAI